MAENYQDNNQESEQLKRAFVPSVMEIVSLLTGSLLVLLVLNTLPAIRSNNSNSYELAAEHFRDFTEKLLAPTNNQDASTVLTVLFWMVVGIFAYIIVWVVSGLISSYRSDVPETKGMILPKGTNRKAFMHESVLRILVRILSTIMLFYWLYLLLASILPYVSSMFLQNIVDFSLISIGKLALSIVVLAASVFVAMVFARCIVLRERVFGS